MPDGISLLATKDKPERRFIDGSLCVCEQVWGRPLSIDSGLHLEFWGGSGGHGWGAGAGAGGIFFFVANKGERVKFEGFAHEFSDATEGVSLCT